jgi:hypothetical protein
MRRECGKSIDTDGHRHNLKCVFVDLHTWSGGSSRLIGSPALRGCAFVAGASDRVRALNCGIERRRGTRASWVSGQSGRSVDPAPYAQRQGGGGPTLPTGCRRGRRLLHRRLEHCARQARPALSTVRAS